jgi:hypothetical protein
MQILNAARKDRFALVCLATMTVWFCQDLIFGDKIPFFRDLASYFYPIKFRVADAFKTAQLPLWDTHMAGVSRFWQDFNPLFFTRPPSFIICCRFFPRYRRHMFYIFQSRLLAHMSYSAHGSIPVTFAR